MANPNPQRVKNILCVRLDNIGDILMTTPAIRAVRESIKGARITLLTSPGAALVARLIPEIDEVLVYDAPWMKATDQRQDSQPDYDRIALLRERNFDMAIIFTVFSQSPLPAALICFLAEIPIRLAHCRENPYQLLTHWVREPEINGATRHEVRRQLDLVKTIECQTTNTHLSLQVLDSDRRHALEILTETGIETTRPWVVVHPGATAPSRRYSPDGYGEVARRLIDEIGIQVVLTGGREETALLEMVKGLAHGAYALPGRFTIGELAAVIKHAALLISNNTGPAHIAAAVGAPVVVLYAQTNPQHTPWQTPNRVLFHDVPCRNCYQSICPEMHHNCLRLVRPYQIVQAAQELLKDRYPILTNSERIQ